MRAPRDRRLARGALALAAVAILVAAAVAQSPVPHGVVFTTDPRALEELVGLLDARDRGTWLVDFGFERRRAGVRSEESITEAQVPPVRVLVSRTTATVDFGDRQVVCTQVDEAPQCRNGRSGAALPASIVYREAVERGVYAVRRAPDRAVAGEHARCYELVAVTGTIAGLGLAGEQCFADDGVPLWSRVADAVTVDTRVARFASRDVTRADLVALLDDLGGEGALDDRG